MQLKSRFAMEVSERVYEMNPRESINNMCLNNSKGMLTHVYKMDYHSIPSDDDFKFNMNEIHKEVEKLKTKKSDGWALTTMPDLFIKRENQYEFHSFK